MISKPRLNGRQPTDERYFRRQVYRLLDVEAFEAAARHLDGGGA